MKGKVTILLLLVAMTAQAQEFRSLEAHAGYTMMEFRRAYPEIEGFTLEDENIPMHGFNMGYAYGFVRDSFIGSVGLDLDYAKGSVSYTDYFDVRGTGEKYAWEHEMKTVSLSLPVAVGYRIGLGDVALTPRLGVGLKLNIHAQETYSCKAMSHELSRNRLKDDMGYDKGHMFQPFGYLGLDVAYRSWFAGCSFRHDFTLFCQNRIEIADSVTEYWRESFRTLQIKVGYRF